LSEKYGENPKFSNYIKGILDRVAVIPGVTAAGMTNRIPLSNSSQTGTQQFEGSTEIILSDRRTASPDYFQVMGIPLLEGRTFTAADIEGRPLVGIVDEQLAKRVWPNQSAIGKHFRYDGSGQNPWFEVVGVV